MKKVKFNGKLNLNKQTVSHLNDEDLGMVMGGAKLTNKACKTSRICERFSADTYCTVTIPCMTDILDTVGTDLPKTEMP